MHARLGDRYKHAAMGPLPDRRRKVGFYDTGEDSPFLLRVWESQQRRDELRECVRDFDVVIFGSAAPVSLVAERVRAGKLTFSATERIWKHGYWRILDPRRFYPVYSRYLSLNRPNHHLLAVGAFCPWDMARIGMFRDRMWKWGYFTSVPAELPAPKPAGPMRVLWVGRMADVKRASDLVQAARLVKDQGVPFELNFVGDGPLRGEVEAEVRGSGLDAETTFWPVTTPEGVRQMMLASHLFVMCSDSREGWGAVVNEALASACCVISSDGTGAAPWLIRHGETGFLYPCGDVETLAKVLAGLLVDRQRCEAIGRRAWEHMHTVWSPEVAADRTSALCGGLLEMTPMPDFADGPCSHPETLKIGSGLSAWIR
jgi:glycosyltransferase involved in cell wall biosynthesis